MNNTLYINATSSTIKDLMIWRIFFFVPTYIYLFVACYTLRFENNLSLFLFIVGAILAIVWLFFTMKKLSKLRKKTDYVALTLNKDSLVIYDGRTFNIDLSEVKYIEWQYYLGSRKGAKSLTEKVKQDAELHQKIGSIVEKTTSIYPTERIVIQTESNYIQIENISTQDINYPDSVEKEEAPRKRLAELQEQLAEALKPMLGKEEGDLQGTTFLRTNETNLHLFIKMGKRNKMDFIDLNSAMIVALILIPLVIMVLSIISAVN